MSYEISNTQSITVVNEEISQETIEVINQFAKAIVQVLSKTNKLVKKIASVLYKVIVKLAEYIEAICDTIESCIQYYEFNEFFAYTSVGLEQSQERAPPQESISEKMQVYYIFFCLFIFPSIAKSIMYCEDLIISTYLFEVIKYLLTFFGVYL